MKIDDHFICACGHSYEDHDGYVRGPEIREWCMGSGTRTEADIDGTPVKVPDCSCVEYDGPDPEQGD